MTPPATPDRTASASEVLELLRGACRPLDAERAPLREAAGRVLREPIHALGDQPPFDRSSMDGFAVRMDDPAKQFRIVDEIRAGDWKPRELKRGEAVRIATGGALPGEGLQVVMREDAAREGDLLSVSRRDGERNIRFRGEDSASGQVLIPQGARLEPGALALLASLGCVRPLVTKVPRVLHLATGNEIVPPEMAPQPGQIRDSNSTLVRAFLAQWGIQPAQLSVPEDQSAAHNALNADGRDADVILVSGGASVGDHDFTRRLLEDLGFAIYVSKTTARPGKPLIVAGRGGTIAFGLPGNPLAHFVCLNLYVRTALESFLGLPAGLLFHTGALTSDLAAGGNSRETFWPAQWRWGHHAPTLTPLRWSSSGDLTPLATANALIRVEPGAERLAQGCLVEFTPTQITS